MSIALSIPLGAYGVSHDREWLALAMVFVLAFAVVQLVREDG